MEYEVSGLLVVESWLNYRMKSGAGKKSSDLDKIRPESWTSEATTELLELLWVLEATIDLQQEQAKLLHAVIAGPCIRELDLPLGADDALSAPQPPKAQKDLF
jgi:hypothetical protein